jgi:hypothetical protein
MSDDRIKTPETTEPIIETPPDWKGDFDIQKFAMADDARDAMGRAFDELVVKYASRMRFPYENESVNLEKADEVAFDSELARIASEHLPKDFIDAAKSSARRELKEPVLLLNAPVQDMPKTLKFSEYSDKLPEPWITYSHLISRALAHISKQELVSQQQFIRMGSESKTPDGHIRGGSIHNDPERVSVIATPCNDQQAPLAFVSMKNVLRDTPRTILNRVKCVIPTQGRRRERLIKQNALEAHDTGAMAGSRLYHFDTASSDPEALQMVQQNIDAHSKKLVLQPGMIVLFNNLEIEHYGTAGRVSMLASDKVTRMFEYNGLGRC